MENLSTLTGKYGEEGDQLLFKILNSGDFLKDSEGLLELEPQEIHKINDLLETFSKRVHSKVNEKCLERTIYNIPVLAEEVCAIAGKLDFSSSIVGEDLRAFLIEDAEFIAYKAFVENPAGKDSGKSTLDLVKKFFATVRSTSTIIKHAFLRRKLSNHIAEKGLRYDLTVPFARYVVMNRNEVTFPFKRYQIQPVWRADRPQKGRYREFYQCDADVVGTNSLLCEAEIILMIKEVFKRLGITDYAIKINHRGVLTGIAEVIGARGNEIPLFVAIDKLDKIGEENVRAELTTKGFTKESLDQLFSILNVKGSITNKLAFLATKFETSTPGRKGLMDLREVFNLVQHYGHGEDHIDFDVNLARGLSYYTGCIFEVKINNVGIGSVSGGGRYDNLTQAFGDKENLSGVGFSFGVDRLYDAMEELNLFPADAALTSKVLICHLDEEAFFYALQVVAALRNAGIATEVYPDHAKVKKQLDYANKKLIPYTIVIGSDEMQTGKLALKNMLTGEQQKATVDEIIQTIR